MFSVASQGYHEGRLLPFPKYAHFEVGLVGLVLDTRGGIGKGVKKKGALKRFTPRADKTKKASIHTRAQQRQKSKKGEDQTRHKVDILAPQSGFPTHVCVK